MPHVLFVEPHPPSQRPFLRGLNRIGVRVTGIGSAPASTLDGELRHLLSGYEQVADLTDVDALVAAVRRAQERGPWVDRLETTFERLLLPVALAREATSIPGEPAATVRLTADKWACRQALRAADVPTVPDQPVTTVDAGVAFGNEVGWPLVLKPKISRGLLVDVHSVPDAETLAELIRALPTPNDHVLERFVDGHEGFFDSLVLRGEVVFEAVTHFYPSVRRAMTDRSVSPVVVHTNRLEEDGYDELRAIHRRAIGAFGLGTTAVHLEWFAGPFGRWVSEVGLHPPPLELWDLFGEAGDLDLYLEWGRALAWGGIERATSRRFAAGLINLRPDRDGVIVGYDGVEAMQRRYGSLIFRMHLPPPGTPTQPISGGYMANAWVAVKHPDYDELRGILADVGAMVRVHADG